MILRTNVQYFSDNPNVALCELPDYPNTFQITFYLIYPKIPRISRTPDYLNSLCSRGGGGGGEGVAEGCLSSHVNQPSPENTYNILTLFNYVSVSTQKDYLKLII